MKDLPTLGQHPTFAHLTLKPLAQAFLLPTNSLLIGMPGRATCHVLALHDQRRGGKGPRPIGSPHDGGDLEEWIRHYSPTRLPAYLGSYEQLALNYRGLQEDLEPARNYSGFAAMTQAIPLGALGYFATKKFVRVSMTRVPKEDPSVYVELRAIQSVELLQRAESGRFAV